MRKRSNCRLKLLGPQTSPLRSLGVFIRSRHFKVFSYVIDTALGLFIASKGLPPPVPALMALLAVFALATAVYVFNDLEDEEVDRLNVPDRPLPSGQITKRDAKIIASLSAFTALGLSILLSVETFVLCSICLIIGYAYSTRSVHLKENTYAKIIVPAIGSALAIIIGGSALGTISSHILLAACSFFLFVIAMAPIFDLKDVTGDREKGVMTVPVLKGPEFSLRFAVAFMFLIPGFTYLAYLWRVVGLLGPVLMGLFCLANIVVMLPLLSKWRDPDFCQKTEKKIFLVSVLIQLTLVLQTL